MAKKPEDRKKPGRKKIDPDLRVKYSRPGLSLREGQEENLTQLADALGIRSRSGVNYGKTSWRTMIALLAEKAPEIVEAIKKQKTDTKRTFFPIKITPQISIIVTPRPIREEENSEEDTDE